LAFALALVAAGRATRLALITFALVAAEALHQYTTTLAVGDQTGTAARLWPLFALARLTVMFFAPRCARLILGLVILAHRQAEVGAGLSCDALAELVAQSAPAHLGNLAFAKLAKLEWPVRHADQAVHLEAEFRQYIAHLAVLALADREA